MQTLIGRKIEQSQRFLENGKRIPVTQVQIDTWVLGVKSVDQHGYAAVQLGAGRKKHPTAAMLGHVKKANLTHVPSFIKETRLSEAKDLPEIGTQLKGEDFFQPGDMVQVTGISKGKGFAGVVKRHNFRGGPRTHGQSDRERAPGSIGQTTTPGRVYLGKRMAGRMGQDQVTVKNLMVVSVDSKLQTMLIDGLLPGSRNTMLVIKKTGIEKKFIPLQKTKEEQTEAPSVGNKDQQREETNGQ